MRQLLLLLLLAFSLKAWPQKEIRRQCAYLDAPLASVFSDIETKFDVKYSYADCIVAPNRISIAPANYTLDELHAAIGRQTSVEIIRIDDRYYSVRGTPETLPVTQLDEILIPGFLSKGITKTSDKFVISPQKVEELPGVTDADVLLSLQQLPGVKSPNETASGLHIRGGTPDQNLILWDGIRMYHPGHLFGMISGFNPNIRQTIHYYNKATNPQFGERISSVIDIATTNDIADSLHIDSGITSLSADVYAAAPLMREKIGLQVSARKSFTEWIRTPTFYALADKVFQNTAFDHFNDANQFGFGDFTAKLNIKPGKNDSIAVSGILIDNDLDFASVNSETDESQQMEIRNYGTSIGWDRTYKSALTHKVSLHYSAYDFNYDQRNEYPDGGFDVFSKKNRIIDSGFESNLQYSPAGNFSLGFGYQLSGNDISHSFTNRTPGLEIELDQKHLFSIAHSVFAYPSYLYRSWDFRAGARVTHFAKLAENSLEPRASVRKKFGADFTAQLSYERKSQVVSQIRESVLSDMSLENYVWILSDGDEYPIQQGNQFTAGIIYKRSGILIDIDAYYRTISGITSHSFGLLHEFDTEVHRGDGFTKGVDVLVQKTGKSWRTWISYTFQDSQNRYDQLDSHKYFAASSDITHAVTLSAYKEWGNFSASAGFFWHTGRPYSRLDENGEFKSFNANRLRSYHKVDVSAAYSFAKNKCCQGKTGFSIGNVYASKTIISREYQRKYGNVEDFFNPQYSARDYHSLGFTPNVFIRLSF